MSPISRYSSSQSLAPAIQGKKDHGSCNKIICMKESASSDSSSMVYWVCVASTRTHSEFRRLTTATRNGHVATLGPAPSNFSPWRSTTVTSSHRSSWDGCPGKSKFITCMVQPRKTSRYSTRHFELERQWHSFHWLFTSQSESSHFFPCNGRNEQSHYFRNLHRNAFRVCQPPLRCFALM